MIFEGKRGSPVLLVLVAALGVYLMAIGVPLAADHSPRLLRGSMPLAANPTPDSACQVVLDAGGKLFSTPFHMSSTSASPGVQGGKPVSSEMVFAGGTRYVLANGKWTRSSASTEELKALEQRNLKNTTHMSCHPVREELVKGEMATVYSMHSETPRSKNDDQIWISKSKGLIVRQESDLIPNGTTTKTHLSIQYDYSNVQAPKL